MWGPYNRSWRKLKEATRPTPIHSPKGSGDIGPVTLHSHGRHHRKRTGFEAATTAYAATTIVGCATAILAQRTGGDLSPLFLIATAITAGVGASFILAARQPWRRRLLLGLPLVLLAVLLAVVGLHFVPGGFHQ